MVSNGGGARILLRDYRTLDVKRRPSSIRQGIRSYYGDMASTSHVGCVVLLSQVPKTALDPQRAAVPTTPVYDDQATNRESTVPGGGK